MYRLYPGGNGIKAILNRRAFFVTVDCMTRDSIDSCLGAKFKERGELSNIRSSFETWIKYCQIIPNGYETCFGLFDINHHQHCWSLPLTKIYKVHLSISSNLIQTNQIFCFRVTIIIAAVDHLTTGSCR